MSPTLPSLLLLPPPPSDTSPANLSAAYRSSITAAVLILKALPTSNQLMIVVPCPRLHRRLSLPRSQVYGELQRILAGIYSLICVVCAKTGTDVESNTPGSIDARVLVSDYDSTQEFDDAAVLDLMTSGPIIDLSVLAITRRHWNLILSVDGEKGQSILSKYISLTNRSSPPITGQFHIVPGGVSLLQNSLPTSTPTLSVAHHVVAVGGTFDHLHAGHKLLLTATALLLEPAKRGSKINRRLIVGITGDELLKNKKYAEYLKSWKQRQDDVIEFLLSVLLFTRTPETAIETSSKDEPVTNGKAIHTTLTSCSLTIECVEIQDPFGPTITDESVSALVVSGETRSGGQAVNEKRTAKGWKALEVFEIDVLDGQEADGDQVTQTESFASKISSSAIRQRKAESGRNSLL